MRVSAPAKARCSTSRCSTSTVQVLTFHAASALNAGTRPTRLGNRHASIAPYEVFEASDGRFNLAVGNNAQFGELCSLLRMPELAQDPRFVTNPERVKNRTSLAALLAEQFAKAPVAHWLACLGEKGIPAGAVLDVGAALAQAELKARGKLPTFAHPTAGPLTLVGSPLPMTDSSRAPPPLLGQHTAEVLQNLLGASPEEFHTLLAQGAVRVQ